MSLDSREVRIGKILLEFLFFLEVDGPSCMHGQVGVKNEANIFPIRTEQARSINDLLLWLFRNLRTAKRISISKRALQRRKKGTNDFHNVIFTEVFAKKARTRFRLHTKLSYLLKCFQNRI